MQRRLQRPKQEDEGIHDMNKSVFTSESVTLGTEMFYCLRRLHISGSGAGLSYHGTKFLGVFKHRTGLHHVLIKRLPIVIGLE